MDAEVTVRPSLRAGAHSAARWLPLLCFGLGWGLSSVRGMAADTSAPPSTAVPEKAGDRPAQPPPVDAKRLAELLSQLGNEDFEEREKATQELVRLGPQVLEELGKLEKTTADKEVEARCRRIRETIGDPSITALAVLEHIEKSEAVFLRPGGLRTNFDGKGFAAHLRAKAALMNFSLIQPAPAFIEKVATSSSRHGAAYLIRLPDGEEMQVAEWLKQKFRASRPQPDPPPEKEEP